jgi:hypothetical protein
MVRRQHGRPRNRTNAHAPIQVEDGAAVEVEAEAEAEEGKEAKGLVLQREEGNPWKFPVYLLCYTIKTRENLKTASAIIIPTRSRSS